MRCAQRKRQGLKDDELAWLLLALLDTAPKGMTAEELAEAVQKFTQSTHYRRSIA
jgi:hypothetical protein